MATGCTVPVNLPKAPFVVARGESAGGRSTAALGSNISIIERRFSIMLLWPGPGATHSGRVAVRRVRVLCGYNAVACVQGNRILVA